MPNDAIVKQGCHESKQNNIASGVAQHCDAAKSGHSNGVLPTIDELSHFCAVYMFGHRFVVRVFKYVTFEQGVYHFDGKPLKTNDPHIISIDDSVQTDAQTMPITLLTEALFSRNKRRINFYSKELMLVNCEEDGCRCL